MKRYMMYVILVPEISAPMVMPGEITDYRVFERPHYFQDSLSIPSQAHVLGGLGMDRAMTTNNRSYVILGALS